MDPVALEKAFEIYPDTRVVVIAHLYGTPGKVAELNEIIKKHNAILIEDAAESMGATYKGVQTGTFGKYNTISFNGNKIITGSSGGCFLTNDEEAANKVRKWSTQARENAAWYQHEELGYNYRMSNVVAGVVRGQFPYLDEHIAQKKAIYERYKEGLKDLPVSMNPMDLENSEPNYWLAILVRFKLGSPVLFTQDRPGLIGEDGKETIFKMYKFRTMTDERDENGELLPDEVRLTSFGKWLRSTSLDELPETFNILNRFLILL